MRPTQIGVERQDPTMLGQPEDEILIPKEERYEEQETEKEWS